MIDKNRKISENLNVLKKKRKEIDEGGRYQRKFQLILII